MPRFAIGDLTIDLDIPPRFRCEYSLSGSLVALDAPTGSSMEVSGIHLGQGDGVATARDRAKKATVELTRDSPSFACYRENANAWLAGFGSHLVIATVKKAELIPEVVDVLAGVGPAHDVFPEGQQTAFSGLRPSHTRWFEQRRTALLDAIGWSPELGDAPKRLDDFWGELLVDPPEDEHLLQTMLSGLTLGFGDLLRRRGFEWCVAKDLWGISIAMVALRGTADLLLVPDSFVAKRWEQRAPRFIEASLDAIQQTVAKAKADWDAKVARA